jgi:hypothetical protein
VLRLINRTMSTQLTLRALQLLQPFQSAVAVRAATLTIATLLQADFTAGRVEGVDSMDALLLDVAHAFGTVRLDKALAALRNHLPELVRWFTIQHESRISLVHAAFGGVGYCETGLLQGDPLMSMLVRAIPLLDPMKRIQALLRANDAQENPRARAFAGDVFGAGGRAERMIPRVPKSEDVIEEDTGMKLQRAQTRVPGRCSDASERSQHTRRRALRRARDSVARYSKKHEPETLQRIQREWNRDKMQRTTIADKQGWAG